MRLLINILIFTQFFYIYEVFAEKYRQQRFKKDEIKWEKLENNEESNNLKKIIWEPFNEDESNFQKDKLEGSFENNNNFKQNLRNKIQIESYVPLNNYLEKGNFDTTVQWKSAFSGGAAGGTGHQNISIRFDYGLSDNTLLSFFIAESDDPLFKAINNEILQNTWSIFSLNAKRKLFESENLKNSISFSSSLEYWIITSGKDGVSPSRSMFNEINSDKGLDRFTEIVSSFSLPFTREINKKTTLALVPGLILLPDILGSRNIDNNFYGNNLFLSTGLEFNLSNNLALSGSYTYLFGPGNNYFNENLEFSRKPIYSFGVNWNVNPIIGFEGKVTNGYGATPATGILTIPSANEALYYLGASYKPYLNDTILIPLDNENKSLEFGGLTVDNSVLPSRGKNLLNFDYDSSGNLFSSYSYSLSNIFQLQLISAGSFKTKNKEISQISALTNTYLNDYNFNYRVGGKLLILSPKKNDLIWLSSKFSLGRDLHSRQGYIFNEFTSTFNLDNWLTFNISPKYLFSGVGNLGVLGLSKNINISNNLQFIAETNLGITKNSANNATFSLRHISSPSRSTDFYLTNSVGFQDIGTMLRTKDYKYGIRVNYIF